MKNALHKGLRLRLWFYFVLVIAEVGLALSHVVEDHVFALYPLVAIAVGIWFGKFVAKAFHISWNEETEEVVTRWDKYGIIILVLSGILELFKEEIVSYFINGSAVIATSFALIAGIMYGRIVGLSDRAARIYGENQE
ncbi:MAG: hypothetical protein JWL80_186 [Parcubacteria group bacterium]|nr:hypothetical protein [Parcubacteria group bacterium]